MPPRFRTLLLAACLLALACLAPATALASSGGVSPSDARYQPAKKAKIVTGLPVAPRGAPAQIVNAIAAANAITRKPYRYGGGHGSFNDSGYDCSRAGSYALHGGGPPSRPLHSASFESWGARGRGQWITVYANSGHAYAIIAGLRFDTSGKGESGPRWRPESRSSSGFIARHPAGL